MSLLRHYYFILYIGLGSDDIYISWLNSDNGDECEKELGDMTLKECYEWVKQCEAGEITE